MDPEKSAFLTYQPQVRIVRFFIEFGRKYYFLLSTKDYEQSGERSYFCLCYNDSSSNHETNFLIKFLVRRKADNRLPATLREIRLDECSKCDIFCERIDELINHYLKNHSFKLYEFFKYVAFNSNEGLMRKLASEILACSPTMILKEQNNSMDLLSLDSEEFLQLELQTGIELQESCGNPSRNPGLFQPQMIAKEGRQDRKSSPFITLSEDCVLCHSTVDDVQRLGPKYHFDELVVHYFCLLFAQNLKRKGHEEDGIFGYLKGDIMRAVKLSERVICVFCHKMGAASRCYRGCNVLFHYRCGVDNKIFSQFKMDQYETYCSQHGEVQSCQHDPQTLNECCLCSSTVNSERDWEEIAFIKTPCCHSHVHRNCLQKEILSQTDHFSKCPLAECKRENFTEIQRLGIYIPGECINVESILFIPKKCSICRSSTHNEWRLGQKFQLDDMVVHHFCLLFAAELVENGDRKEISGYLKGDILREIERAEQFRCTFCNELGAASNCCEPSCEIKFHYPCGLNNGIFSRFNNHHDVYCSNHWPSRHLWLIDRECALCLKELEVEIDPVPQGSMRARCCGLIFHATCLNEPLSMRDTSNFWCQRCGDRDPIEYSELWEVCDKLRKEAIRLRWAENPIKIRRFMSTRDEDEEILSGSWIWEDL